MYMKARYISELKLFGRISKASRYDSIDSSSLPLRAYISARESYGLGSPGATSMYLLAQYFLKMEGRHADLELEGLTEIYHNMQIVNVAIANRLRSTSMSDSSINAIIILDNYAKSLPYAIEKSLEDLRHLFLPFLR